MPRDESSDDVALVQSCYEAWSARDLERLLSFASEDCVYQMHVPTEVWSLAGLHEGKAAIRATLQQIDEAFGKVRFAVDWISGQGGTVRSRVIYYFDHAETGAHMDGAARHVWRLADNRVTRLDAYHDVARLKAFLDMVRSLGKS